VYVKLFGTILDSSIWATDLPTRVVWITMLAMADEYGIVSASVGGLARRACVSEKECSKALKNLLAPDPDSRTKEHDGRRIEPLEGGWRLLNYAKYRELRTKKQMADAMRQTRHRHNKRDVSQQPVTSHDVTTEAEAEAEAAPEAEANAKTESKALVALTRDGIVAELSTLFDHQHVNGGLREAKAKLIFAYWAAKWDHGNAVYDARRQARLHARLRENSDDVSELLWVVDGAKRDDWVERSRYAGIEQLFRDRGAVEKFASLAPGYQRREYHPMAAKFCPQEKNDAVG